MKRRTMLYLIPLIMLIFTLGTYGKIVTRYNYPNCSAINSSIPTTDYVLQRFTGVYSLGMGFENVYNQEYLKARQSKSLSEICVNGISDTVITKIAPSELIIGLAASGLTLGLIMLSNKKVRRKKKS